MLDQQNFSTLLVFQRDSTAFPLCSDWAQVSFLTQRAFEERRVTMAIVLLFQTSYRIMSSFLQSLTKAF